MKIVIETVLTYTHDLCYVLSNEKKRKIMFTPVNPQFYYIKAG